MMADQMDLHIKQEQHYRGKDWWNWSVWIEGSEADLKKVKEVAWHLHPTFNPSVVHRTDWSDGFRLRTAGWGTFTIVAELTLQDGSRQRLEHELELYYPEPDEWRAADR